ncbi:hypothetical protein PCANC_24969 [Puccinia coronata f. sp. avenae]|uniref:Uncharacterized protein n=1 Tax=Puccinia coronata f. sp. avenae TaxID=200324 RepID=A0A2N5TV35_9BASI|nr:hypothetical protein PCANC_24969 [Puccinia coronata f. sp. avenae]
MPEDTPPAAGTEVVQRSHSVDVLHDFRNTIINVFMGYIIFQTHFLSSPPRTQKQKKQNTPQTSAPSTSGDLPVAATSQTPTDLATQKAASTKQLQSIPSTSGDLPVAATSQTPTDLATQKAASTKQLQSIQVRQNFQPLVCFLLAGARGLFITSMDHRTASATDCMTFIEAISFITQHSKTPHTPAEPICKNLSAYLVELFQPAFRSPNNVVPIAQAPSRIKLAEAITMDFLNHWKEKQPSSPFLIPQSTTIQPVTES